MPPKFAFWAGVVTATAVISVIGFVVMAMLVVKGVDLGDGKANSKSNTGAVAAGENEPAAAQDSIDPDSLRNTRGEGDITVVEYSDLECPFCKQFHGTLQQLLADNEGEVRWSYKHFPLTSLHPKAQREAEASECAAEQGKFWEYVDRIIEITPSNNKLEDQELFNTAEFVGLDVDEFTDCLESGAMKDRVAQDAAEAQALGGTGTPFSVLIDEDGNVIGTIPGALPIASLQQALDQAKQ